MNAPDHLPATPVTGTASPGAGAPPGRGEDAGQVSAVRAALPRAVGGGLAVIVLGCLPLLALTIPGVLPGYTYEPGTLQLLGLCWLTAALALTYHLLLGVVGLLSFGHALYFAAGVYGLAVVLERTDIPLLPAAAVVLAGGVLLAGVIGAISLRVTGISFAMVTLAFAQAGNVLVRRDPADLTGGEEGIALATGGVPDAFVGVVNTRNLYWVALAVLVVTYLVALWIERSRAGHMAAAVRENETRVRIIGGRPYVVKLVVFVLAATLATMVGTAYLLLQSGASPAVSTADFTLTILVMVVLGGVGSRWGAVVGAVLYTVLDQRLGEFAGSEAVAGLPAVLRVPLSEPMFLLGTCFILVVMFLPGGIAGAASRAVDRVRRRGPRGPGGQGSAGPGERPVAEAVPS
ncbi:branched-chain amino acid ABC transporter permease [Myceligenerans indicum]|uniref:Branched-chain amino acid ABC transporter permease n=1 Tax=Myceligenerans indicum TaxID=2593663 RepID=A0ABS1LF92_9MICO|nr:branched-chain amino acid ABC transporter permease [Myceligenerans indicum]MBL0884922.1 branched-chain amino acid ABC transporter permease [Myceligenerans indicum]